MTIRTLNTRAENWAFSLVGGVERPPVYLYAIARRVGVKRIRLRRIIPKGLLVPTHGGFNVYLRDERDAELSIDRPEPVGFLTVRQRFALAHEIAHTMFF